MLKLSSSLARVAFGYALASVAAGLVTVLFVNTPADVMSVPFSRLPETASETFGLALLTATHAALFAAAFVLIVAGLGEWFSIREMSFYVVAGIAIAALGFGAQYSSEVAGQPTIFNGYAMAAFLTAGLFAGFVYWLAAGQFAGVPPETETPTGTQNAIEAATEAPNTPALLPPEADTVETASKASRHDEPATDKAAEADPQRPRFVDAARTSYNSLVGKIKTLAPRRPDAAAQDGRGAEPDDDSLSVVVKHPTRSEPRFSSRDDEEPGV